MEIQKLIITPFTKNTRSFISYNPSNDTAATLIKERIEIGNRQPSKNKIPHSTKRFLKELREKYNINLNTIVTNK